jgi:hypothetical protein
MKKFGWRLLFLLLFLPCAFPWGVCEFAQICAACLCWLIAGGDEDRTTRILLAPPAAWFIAPLDYVSAQMNGVEA